MELKALDTLKYGPKQIITVQLFGSKFQEKTGWKITTG
jgi:hypothetical protein